MPPTRPASELSKPLTTHPHPPRRTRSDFHHGLLGGSTSAPPETLRLLPEVPRSLRQHTVRDAGTTTLAARATALDVNESPSRCANHCSRRDKSYTRCANNCTRSTDLWGRRGVEAGWEAALAVFLAAGHDKSGKKYGSGGGECRLGRIEYCGPDGLGAQPRVKWARRARLCPAPRRPWAAGHGRKSSNPSRWRLPPDGMTLQALGIAV